jgi:hypothetical protein
MEQKKKQNKKMMGHHYIMQLGMATLKLQNFWLRMEQKKKQKTNITFSFLEWLQGICHFFD